MKIAKGAKTWLSGVKFLLRRFSLLFLVMLTFGLMLLAKADNLVFQFGKKVAVEVLVPTMYVLFTPISGFFSFVDEVKEVASLREMNQQLKEENQRLSRIKAKLHNLEIENQRLTELLNYKKPPDTKSVAARVIIDPAGAFAQSLVVMAGENDGISKGDVVMTGEGLVGRVAYVTPNVSQILLLSDFNSRVPVFVGDKEYRAILAGNNTEKLRLIAFPDKAEINVGDKVITSGDGGVFPFGLIVGYVHSKKDDVISVLPSADRSRLEFVSIINFGLKGILEDVKCKE